MLNQSSAPMLSSVTTLPNFFIVGAPKAGTTSLYYYLDQHPSVYMSPIKEPNYFATEIRIGNIGPQWQGWAQKENDSLRKYLSGPMREKRFGGLVSNSSDYLKLFQNVSGEKAIGEASVCYLWSKTAAQNIASATPSAKIIMVLRNPVDRAFSQYKQAVACGLVGRSFREHIRISLNSKSDKFEVLNPFLEYGLYYEQVKRYTDLFRAQNLRIYLYDDYRNAPENTLADSFEFLEVDPEFSPDMSERHLDTRVPRFIWISYMLRKCGVWPLLKRAAPATLRPGVRKLVSRNGQSLEIDPADRAFLSDYYREDAARLSTLIQRDLDAWLR
jgi:hypothetical protein